MDYQEYTDKVLDYLEYLNYPDYIVDFYPEQVSASMQRAMIVCYMLDVSFRHAALVIFGVTMEQQILPTIKGQVKH